MTNQPVQLTAQQFNYLLGMVVSGHQERRLSNNDLLQISQTSPSNHWYQHVWRWMGVVRGGMGYAQTDDQADDCRSHPWEFTTMLCRTAEQKIVWHKWSTLWKAASETQLCSWKKEIVVKGLHRQVHHIQFVHCRQRQDKCLNLYHGRLKAASSLWDFQVPAPATCMDIKYTRVHHGM